MPIAENKTKMIVIIPKEWKKQLEEKAKKEKRSLNNLLNIIIEEYLQNS